MNKQPLSFVMEVLFLVKNGIFSQGWKVETIPRKKVKYVVKFANYRAKFSEGTVKELERQERRRESHGAEQEVGVGGGGG